MATITNRQINRKLEGSNSSGVVMVFAPTGFCECSSCWSDNYYSRCQRRGWQALGTASESSPRSLSCQSVARSDSGWPLDPSFPCHQQGHELPSSLSAWPSLPVFIQARGGASPPQPPPPHLSPPRDKQCAPLPCGAGAKFCQPCSPHFLLSRALGGRKQYRLPISGERRPKLQPEIKKPRPSVNWARPTRVSEWPEEGWRRQASRGSPRDGSQRGQKSPGPCRVQAPGADLRVNAGCHDHSWHGREARAAGLLKPAWPRSCRIPGLVNTLKWQVLWKPQRGCADP